MEQPKWEKDTTPYLVFSCTKCKQYGYVKTSQKTKKCLRCGRTHQVKNILPTGQIVKGITSAMNKVKEFQNMLGKASFQVDHDFKIVTEFITSTECTEKSLDKRFNLLLDTLSSQYHHFPMYLIELLSPQYHIPEEELSHLIRKALREEKLTEDDDNYYIVIK